MAKRYFTIFRKHIAVLLLIILFCTLSAVTNGMMSTATAIIAGIMLIGSVIRYTIWLFKTTGVEIKEENL